MKVWDGNLKILLLLLLISFTDGADKFAEKMSPYYGRQLGYEMYYFKNGWWGATVWENGSCTDTVYLSTRFYNETSDIWKFVLAHEWAHVYMGRYCKDEAGAHMIGFQKLIEAKEWSAVRAGVNHMVERHGWDRRALTDRINEISWALALMEDEWNTAEKIPNSQ